MISHVRRVINPPYTNKDLISIFVALFIMLAIPLTVLQVTIQRDQSVGAQTSEKSVKNDSLAPTVEFNTPQDNAYIAGSNYKISLSANDEGAVSKVTLEIDGKTVAKLSESPYEYTWDLSGVSAGNHVIKATAEDSSGNVQSASVQIYRGIKPISLKLD